MSHRPEWNEDDPLLSNYHGMGVVPNPNRAAENKSKCPLKVRQMAV